MTFRPYAAFTAAALAITVTTSVAAQDFRALASQDLVTAQQEIRENHPALIVDGPEAAAFALSVRLSCARKKPSKPPG